MVDGESNGIIGEPTMLEVVYAHKGTYGFVATSKGRAAHSSTREGINANLAMIPFLTEMKSIHDEIESDPSWKNNEFDPPTMSWNIGINDHTKAFNITPPQSVCTVYFRPMPGQNADALVERARKAAVDNRIEFDLRSQATPLYVDPQSDFVKEVLQLTGKKTPRTVSYGTDGAMLSALKKIVVLGPGDIAQAHMAAGQARVLFLFFYANTAVSRFILQRFKSLKNEHFGKFGILKVFILFCFDI